MASQLREGIVAAQPEPALSGEAGFDEVYVVAGHKGRKGVGRHRKLTTFQG
jgi:hypothetical protein